MASLIWAIVAIVCLRAFIGTGFPLHCHPRPRVGKVFLASSQA